MITLVVVEVPIQLALGLGRVALVVLVVLGGVEAVALVEAAGRRAVLGPVWNIASTAYGTLADAIAATPAGVQDQ